ncbi:ATP-dependent DNA helicase [Microbacterium thalassium]|uniref:DNA 3'-5' helicase n=1 Tax=Microbacterium thalassium TaxID=362649 RepID=A0A7X0FSG5_9MICO|nr:ATP-dependent DNA helicase [Microbacterium thalassium]MBB6392290.1 superfamily I DNA/RNA helicase [Microbacterium thalassium]
MSRRFDASARLDADQRSVVDLDPEASGVVLGAPGTGKTTVLVRRVARLLTEAGLEPDELLVLTPTRQTATELRDRLAAGLDVATPGPLARSTSSFAFQLVRAAAVAADAAPPLLLTAGDQDRIIAELLAGDEEDAAHGADRWPAALSPAVRRSRAFRSELRALFAECAELGLAPADLGSLATAQAHETWAAAAGFAAEYAYTLGRMRADHRDPAQLVHEAAGLLATADAARIGPASRLRVLLIDDAQELTRGGVALVEAARERGIAVLAFGDPDIASGAFRGASVELFEQLVRILGSDVHVLDGPHRAAPGLTRLTRSVTASIGASGRVDHRRAPGPVTDDDAVTAIVADSPFAEVDRIARTLRTWHVMDGIAWDDMAVIAHDTRQVAQLDVELAAREVPTRAASVPRPLGREEVVRDLVGIVRLGMTDADERDPDDVADALLTAFGGLDAVGLRRLRARLRVAELAEEGTRSARELLAAAMREPAWLALIDSAEARRAGRLAAALEKVHHQARRGATIHELLWTVWERSGLEQTWLRRTQSGGAGADEATRSLDALVALFGAAKRSVERAPEEGPAGFIREILDSDVPEDMLTAPERSGTVALLTPASALGTEFEAVILAGVQDGVWPNTRLRGGLLDAWRLADAAAAWRDGAAVPEPAVLDRRRSALHEELRLFARAVSRARSRVVVTAVDDDDLGPSALFAYLPDPVADAGDAASHPLTLRGLVARHRRTLTSTRDGAERAHAARQLALLADAGVPGAHPDEWFGVAGPSSTAPLHDLDVSPVRISPSRLEGFEKCALDWAVRALGGDTSSFSSGLGTILHAAMEAAPDGELTALREAVDDRWGELPFEAEWLERQERAWAEVLVQRLHVYLRRVGAEGGVAVGAESRFRLAIDLPGGGEPSVRTADADDEGPAALLSGSIDRVEVYPPGRGEDVPVTGAGDAQRVVVLDLKTGRSESRVSADKVADDAQLAAYQLAVAEGLVEGVDGAVNAGARLLVLSKTLKGTHYRIAHQPPMDDEARAAFLRRIGVNARGMAASDFTANVDAHCTDDRFAVCRLHTVKAVSSS